MNTRGALVGCGLPVLILLGGAGAFVSLSSLKPDRPEATVQERVAPLVRVEPLQPRSVTLDVVGHGTVRARDEVHLSVEVAGRVAFVATNLRPGSFVERDQLLVRLDGRAQGIAHKAALADVAAARAAVGRLRALGEHLEREVELREERAALAKGEWERQQRLRSQGVASQDRLDAARQAYVQEESALSQAHRARDVNPHDLASAEARLAAAQAALERAEHDLTRLELRAPLRAQVRARDVELGRVLAPGAPVIALAGHEAYEVAVQISHADLTKLAFVPKGAIPRGIKAPPGVAGRTPAQVLWLAHPESRWEGHLTRVESVDPDTRTIPAVVEVSQPWSPLERGQPPLLIGAYCRVTLQGKARAGAWLVPEVAIREGERLYLLREGKLAIVGVQVDHRAGEEAVITPREPIQPGDQLIVSRLAYPVVGMSLRVAAAAKAGSPAEEQAGESGE